MVVVTQRQTPQVSTGYKEVWKVVVHMKGGQDMDGGRIGYQSYRMRDRMRCVTNFDTRYFPAEIILPPIRVLTRVSP
jgi:hypothetical protein